MPHPLWKGDITFGLVNIPVELYPARAYREFKFSMLDKHDFSPIGYKRYNKNNNKEVEWVDVVKGYEYEKNKYVVLSDEDFRRANVKASQAIDIHAFVPALEIPVEYFDTPYFLAPNKRGKKAYVLLREALRSSGRVAVAQVVIRATQHLAAVVPKGRALMLNTMRYSDQLREPEDIDLPAEGLKGSGVTIKEVELAKRLVSDMAEHWKAAEFRDSYHQDLMRRIKEKIRNGETKQITEADGSDAVKPQSARVIDLAALLRQSLAASATSKSHARRPGSARPNKSTINEPLPSVSGSASKVKRRSA